MVLIYAGSVQFVNERIPTLKEAATLCEELGLVMFIELKTTSNIERVSRHALSINSMVTIIFMIIV